MNHLWEKITTSAGVVLSEEQGQKLSQYLDLLVAGNERMNLTRIVNREAAEIQHVADALTLLPFLPPGEIKLIDVGSGGGVPGMLLAIARPEMRVTLLEATKKKALFLKETATALGLANVTISDERAEDAGWSVKRESFDVATARAVATIDWLAEWCLPLVKKGGKVLMMKGPRHADELVKAVRAIRLLGGGDTVVHPITDIPGATGLVVVEIKKTGRTDERYPRPATEGKAMG